MRQLDLIKDQLDDEVLNYVDAWPAENSYEESETEFSIIGDDGNEYEVTVTITARFNFREDSMTDDYGNRVSLGREVEVRGYDYKVKDLWDCESGKCLIDEYEEVA